MRANTLFRLSRVLLPSVAMLAVLSTQAVPSFSGAEGWGAITVGGRGGQVLHVTNLNDNGPGSFREACEASGPRTVVFDVSGIIQITNVVKITNSFITIAGQTAPGNGIMVAGETVDMDGAVSEVMVRYMRFRRGYNTNKWTAWLANQSNPDPRGQCLVGLSTTRNIMVDHVSVSWGSDENMSIYRRFISPPVYPGGPTVLPAKNVTIQWCISAEALNPANHAYADTLGGQGANHHHNLLACNVGRNPSISFSHFMDWRNNVIYNWRDRTMDGGGEEAHMNVISNYYKPGIASGYDFQWNPIPLLKVRIAKPEIRQNGTNFGLPPKNHYCYPGAVGWWYVQGNIVEGYPEVSSNNWEGLSLVNGSYYRGVQWGGATSDAVDLPYPGFGPGTNGAHPEWTGSFMTNHMEWARVLSPFTHVDLIQDTNDPGDDINGVVIPIPDLPKIATETAQQAYYTVLAGAGCTLPVRDPVDTRITNMVWTGISTNGTNHMGIINTPDEAGGYPVMPVVSRPANFDTDGDGMPDDWEIAHGLNPNDPSDGNGDYDNDGFSNLEEYLNELGAFKAVEDVIWTGATNSRYAQIENWDITFQPSRFDTTIISNATVYVDAIGQDAGILRLTNNAVLNVTNGWLKVADKLIVGTNCTAAASYAGALNVASNIVNDGTLRFKGASTFTVGGSLTNNGVLDVMTWTGVLPAGLVNNGTILDRNAIKIMSAQTAGPDFVTTIQGYLGHDYQLQYSDDLLGGTWHNVGSPVAGAGAPIQFTHLGGVTGQQRFYRVSVD